MDKSIIKLFTIARLSRNDTHDATLFYPIVDRFDKFLYEELNRQITESSIRSPYTVTWGNNISRYADYISKDLCYICIQWFINSYNTDY